MRVFSLVALASSMTLRAQAPVDDILRRVAEEAAVFSAQARDMISQETLTHRQAKEGQRYRAAGSGGAAPLAFDTRRVVSEYAFGSFQDSPTFLHEFRKITSIDGRPLADSAAARKTLSLNLKSADDRVKRELLREFAKAGIEGGATDFGQLILLFTKRRQAQYEFEERGSQRIGADVAWVVAYREKDKESLTVFEGKKTGHVTAAGEIWVRHRDLLPVKFTMETTLAALRGAPEVRIDVEVEYDRTPHGVLMPVAVTHRETAKEILLTENIFQYAPFRRFSAGTEIKFDPPADAKKP